MRKELAVRLKAFRVRDPIDHHLPCVLVHFSATLRATLAWNHPHGLAAGNASLTPFAGNLGPVTFETEVNAFRRSDDLRASSAVADHRRGEKCSRSVRACPSRNDL